MAVAGVVTSVFARLVSSWLCGLPVRASLLLALWLVFARFASPGCCGGCLCAARYCLQGSWTGVCHGSAWPAVRSRKPVRAQVTPFFVHDGCDTQYVPRAHARSRCAYIALPGYICRCAYMAVPGPVASIWAQVCLSRPALGIPCSSTR